MALVALQAQSAQTAGAVAGGGVATIIGLALTIISIVAMWRLFQKAGRPGWASIIPLYNAVVLLQISGRSGWWLLGLMVPLLNLFVLIRLCVDLAHSFGRGFGFILGLVLLSPIFMLILGLGDDRYLGPAGRGQAVSDRPLAATSAA